MTLTQLRYIVAIADTGLNITLAAEHIHATQPGVSKQLKQLEGELGFQIFTRRGKSLSAVTPAGQQVLVHARVVVDRARSIRSLAANLRGDAQGQLLVLTTHTQARFVLPPAIAAFRKHHPRVSLHLRPHGDARVQSLFADGEADLAIISSSGPVPLGGVAVPLYRWQRVVVVPRRHPLAARDGRLCLGDLAGQPLVSYDSSLSPGSSLQRAFADCGMRPRLACTSSDADLIKTYVRAGLGVGILAEMAVAHGADRDLAVLDAEGLLPGCTTWLVLRRDRVLRSYVLDLVAQLAPHIDLRDVQAVLRGDAEPAWPRPPAWATLQGELLRAA